MAVDAKDRRVNLPYWELEIQYMNFPKKMKDKKEIKLKSNYLLIWQSSENKLLCYE